MNRKTLPPLITTGQDEAVRVLSAKAAAAAGVLSFLLLAGSADAFDLAEAQADLDRAMDRLHRCMDALDPPDLVEAHGLMLLTA